MNYYGVYMELDGITDINVRLIKPKTAEEETEATQIITPSVLMPITFVTSCWAVSEAAAVDIARSRMTELKLR